MIYSLFVSYGNKQKRCNVWNTSDHNFEKVAKIKISFIDKLFEKNNGLPEFIKLDYVNNVEEKDWQDVGQQKHNNHYRKGISLNKALNISFLEQEVYGKSIVKGVVYKALLHKDLKCKAPLIELNLRRNSGKWST